MHIDVWYDLMLRELSEDDAVGERLREAEAVQLPVEEPPQKPA